MLFMNKPYPNWNRGITHALMVLLGLIFCEGSLYVVAFWLMNPHLRVWQWLTIFLITIFITLLGFIHGAFNVRV